MASLRHFIRAGACACGSLFVATAVSSTLATAQAAATPSGSAQPAPAASAKFLIFIRAAQIGTEESSLAQTPDGWTISGSGRLGPPIDVTTRRLEVKYDSSWAPQELTIDAVTGGRSTPLRTIVSGGSADSEYRQDGKPAQKRDAIDPKAVLLPNPFFAPYEALTMQLGNARPGDTLSLYLAPQASVTATVDEVTTERLQTVERVIEARRSRLTLAALGNQDLNVVVWGDERGRLLRLSVPHQSLEVVRDDIGAVSTRRVTVSRPGDESVTMPANGFILTGTVSKPATASAQRLPAVVLVGGAGQTDRDVTVAGIPVLGQLAGALADDGFLVLRFDKRGVGQSGGRPESATFADYAEDVRAVVRYVGNRKDVDRSRLAVIGHSEGGSVGLIAASKDRRIAALVLVACSGVTGAELNLAQVNHSLSRSSRPEADKQATLDLQQRIQQAVLTGRGWESIPANLRRQADIPAFQSFLAFDPAKPMEGVRQPILIVQGLLDTQVAPSNADRLEQLAKARKRSAPVEVVKVAGVNHLLVPATTGEVDEYATLPDKTISRAVSDPIAGWLTKTLKGR